MSSSSSPLSYSAERLHPCTLVSLWNFLLPDQLRESLHKLFTHFRPVLLNDIALSRYIEGQQICTALPSLHIDAVAPGGPIRIAWDIKPGVLQRKRQMKLRKFVRCDLLQARPPAPPPAQSGKNALRHPTPSLPLSKHRSSR